MRLRPDEIDGLIKATAMFLNHYPGELRLFGSRTDDNLKGGDIDLLLIVKDTEVKKKLQWEKHLLLAKMKELIGDQKIDLKIIQFDEIKNDSFLELVYPKSILLKTW